MLCQIVICELYKFLKELHNFIYKINFQKNFPIYFCLIFHVSTVFFSCKNNCKFYYSIFFQQGTNLGTNITQKEKIIVKVVFLPISYFRNVFLSTINYNVRLRTSVKEKHYFLLFLLYFLNELWFSFNFFIHC